MASANLDDPFDVVIVGSGYGGSVAAHALAGRQVTARGGQARALKVCVLERGREYQPGDFPDRFEDMPAHLRRADQATGKLLGNPQGLFDVRTGPDVVALVASGVGGGSLINAGVLLEPRLADFDCGSPAHTLISSLQEGGWYETALRLLGGKVGDGPGGWVENTIARHPEAVAVLKTAALASLDAFGFRRPMITVSMDGLANEAGVVLEPCNLCGDCLSGCNVGAKNSLDANLLDSAERRGVAIYSGASVLSLERAATADGESVWALRVAHTDSRVQDREPDTVAVRARRVILAAGTLGSTEILLRSRSEQAVWSPVLGAGFSCNGDNLAAVHRMPRASNACADEDMPLACRKVGPTITGSVTMAAMQRTFQLQEFSVPGPLKRLFEELVTTGQALADLPRSDCSTHGSEADDAIDPMAVDDEAIRRTLVVGTIGHDEADGLLHLPHRRPARGGVAQQGMLAIRWPEARHGKRLEAAHERVRSAVEALRRPPASGAAAPGAVGDRPSLIANPVWRLLPDALEGLISQPRGPVLTVHPLGGCRIGRMELRDTGGARPGAAVDTAPAESLVDTARPDTQHGAALDDTAAIEAHAGVVDEFGRVYDFAALEPLETLVVLDGSIIPGSLGVNPALTITATALRAMDALCKQWAYTLLPDTDPAPASAPGQTPAPTLAPAPAPVQWQRRASPRAEVPGPVPELPTRRGATEIQIVERLSGTVSLATPTGGAAGSRFIVELTLAYEPLAVRLLMDRLNRRLEVDKADERSRMRIFDQQVWEDRKLKLETDDFRQHFALFDARLGGSLTVLDREASTPWQRVWRAAWAWFWNRGKRDLAQEFSARRKSAQPAGRRPGFWSSVVSMLRMASRAGEARRLVYQLTVEEVLPAPGQPAPMVAIRPGAAVRGTKRLTFGRRANPWRQLTELTLESLPGLLADKPAVLKLDGRFLAGQGFPLLKIVRQRNAAAAQLDLLSFGLYMARLIAGIHLWTFRKPDTPVERGEPQRLPGPIRGLAAPEVTELVVDRMPRTGAPVIVRLTRYNRRADGTLLNGPPLVMIHGYSASGNTYTHPSLEPSAAAWFCGQGRDVWVVDLRTSAGLPTSVYPWAMEQVGLVDIPAALLHIRNRTRQPVDVLAHCIGAVMLSMAVLTDAAEIRNNDIELGSDVWLDEAQLGNLKAFNQASSPGGSHPCIRKLILSQKGPVLRYTDDNIFRAFVLQSVRRWLLSDDYRFRPSPKPGVAEQLMDRLLASLPYPDADYDIENPCWPWSETLWTATRHRMDALYGRSFNAARMNAATLAAIDDIFGPMNLDTVSQTIDFARVGAITNRSGRGEFVTRGRLLERWGRIPTLSLHGGENGLVDILTQDLMKEHLQAAGVPWSEPPREKYAEFGHQDVMMGTGARAVFADIQAFLEAPAAIGMQKEMGDVVTLPWSGPRIDLPDDERPGTVRVACLSDPSQGCGRLWLVPVRRSGAAQGAPRYELSDSGDGIACSKSRSSAEWMFVEPRLPVLGMEGNEPADTRGDEDVVPGWLAVIIYPSGETTAVLSGEASAPPERELASRAGSAAGKRPPETDDDGKGPERRSVVKLPPEIRPGTFSHVVLSQRIGGLKTFAGVPSLVVGTDGADAADKRAAFERVREWLRWQRPQDLDLAFVTRRAVESANALVAADARADSLHFALASCQYPGGLLDGTLSQAVLQQLARSIDAPATKVDLVLFVGDQIYADATAGLVDPVRRDELYERPNDKALRAPGLRAVLRRVPTLMLLDDHELRDNWEPVPPSLAKDQSIRESDSRRALQNGLRAWAKFQRMRPLTKDRLLPAAGDFAFKAHGYPFRFVDTRTGRSARGSTVPPGGQLIMKEAQWLALQAWLVDHPNEIKFIATPSLLLPRRRASAADPSGSGHSDAWDAYPASMNLLLSFLVKHQIGRTVFLSGDEHHSMVTEAVIRSRSEPRASVRIVSVHSSGTYAPYPFANGHPDELATETSFVLPSVTVELSTRFAPPGDGFARVGVDNRTGQSPCLSVQWAKAGGFVGDTVSIAL